MPAGAPVSREYLGEHIREAIAAEAHSLGIKVLVADDEVVLEGRVESDEQRTRIADVARVMIAERTLVNRIEVVITDPVTEAEEIP
jgi:osmotically-inducible protein OsmY